MRITLTLAALIVAGNLVYLNIFLPVKISKKIKNRQYLQAFNYCYLLQDSDKIREVGNLIENEFKKLSKKLKERRLERGELKKMIDYLEIIDVDYATFLKIVELLFDREEEKLIIKLIEKTDKPAWKKVLKKDLQELQNAE